MLGSVLPGSFPVRRPLSPWFLPVDLPCHPASQHAISRPTLNGEGSVAQLVEQGIENPCVGGSIPSQATFLLLLTAVLTGCSEPCETACQRTAFAIGRCIGDWSVDWSDLGASSQTNFRERCQETWQRDAAGLESRELEEAMTRCESIQEEVLELDCDTLRALYLP